MFEFLMFVAACAAIVFLVTHIQQQVNQPKVKLQPIKIERKDERRKMPHRERPY